MAGITNQTEQTEEMIRERVILAAVNTGDERETTESLDELEQLAETAGAEVIARTVQNLDRPISGTYFGSGKAQELGEMALAMGADSIICDDELSPAQMKNLEDITGCKILDRTMLILDIFAARARTAEGRVQVELAQLQYRMSRLAGIGREMSRLGGGIGTRGPGEKQLEVDRRVIRSRVGALRRELKEIESHRTLIRDSRKGNAVPVIAIVGYTNAGKSTLLNRLTGAGILAEDKLFATLDPTTRKMEMAGGQEVLFTDTVGFIRKLPHNLIDAFHSTLEEAAYADIILHVVNSASPQMEKQMWVVYDTLHQLGADGKKIFTVFNKCDVTLPDHKLQDHRADRCCNISALTGEGLEEFEKILEEMLNERQVLIERVYPYDQAGKTGVIRKYGRVLEEKYEEDGIHIKAYIPQEVYGRV